MMSLIVLLLFVLGAAATVVVSHLLYPSFSQVFDADMSQVTGQNKVFIVGEFGLVPTSTISSFLNQFVSSTAASGALIWSLRGHAKEGGFRKLFSPAEFCTHTLTRIYGSAQILTRSFMDIMRTIIQDFHLPSDLGRMSRASWIL